MGGLGGSSLFRDISCAGFRSGITRFPTFDHPFTVQRRLRGGDVGDRRGAWEEVLKGALAGLETCDEGTCAGDSGREGVAGADVDADEDAAVASGVDRGD